MSHLLRKMGLGLVLSPLATAFEDILYVDAAGGADFTTIQAAVDAASEGDTILVAPGTYPEKVVIQAKGLTLVGSSIEGPDGERVSPILLQAIGYAGNLEIADLSAGQRVLVRGFDVVGSQGYSSPSQVVLLRDSAGPIRFEDLEIIGGYEFQGWSGGDGSRAVNVTECSSVGLVRCDLRAGGDAHAALVVSGSSVHIYESRLQGGDGTVAHPFGEVGGDGAWVNTGFLYVAGSELIGGDGADSLLQDGGAGSGGCGIEASFGAVVRVLDCTFHPGAGGSPSAPDGQPIVTWGAPPSDVVLLGGTAASLRVDPIASGGEPFALELRGDPGDAVVLWAALQAQHLYLEPWLGSLFLSGSLIPVHVGALDAGGELDLLLTAPSLPIPALTAFFQAAFVDPQGVVLGSSSALLLLGTGS